MTNKAVTIRAIKAARLLEPKMMGIGPINTTPPTSPFACSTELVA